MTSACTTLEGLISIVPELGMACSMASTVSVPGSGLKLMRLVSRQLSIDMMAVVKGYTLNLDGCSTGVMEQLALLQRTRCRLSHLRVVVTEKSFGRFIIPAKQHSVVLFSLLTSN